MKAVRWLKSLPRPVHIYFEKENIHTKDSDSELMITIFGSIAQEESINIGNSISWGKRSQAERGIIKVGNRLHRNWKLRMDGGTGKLCTQKLETGKFFATTLNVIYPKRRSI